MFGTGFLKFLKVSTVYKELCVRNIHLTKSLNAGHSKWANIRHTKALKDAQRSDLFAKLGRQIRVAIVEGGMNADPNSNQQLRSIVDHAIKQNMPNASIQKVLASFSKDSKNQMKRGILEVKLLSQNIFVICEVFSDNFAKTKQDLATVLRKSGMASFSQARHFFDEKGIILTKALDDSISLEQISELSTEHAIETGAEDVQIVDEHEKFIEFLCDPTHLETVKKNLEQLGYNIDAYERTFVPKSTVSISQSDLELFEQFKSKVLSVNGIENVFDNLV